MQRYLIWTAATEKSKAWQSAQAVIKAAVDKKRSTSQKGIPKAERGATSSGTSLKKPTRVTVRRSQNSGRATGSGTTTDPRDRGHEGPGPRRGWPVRDGYWIK